jgi:Uracil DNA glycosylase superfamily
VSFPDVRPPGRSMGCISGGCCIRPDELRHHHSIHCHPPGDRDPKPEESKNCAGFLRKELREIVQPRLVIGVGRYAKAAVRSLYEAEARELNWLPSSPASPIRLAGHDVSPVPTAPVLDHDPARTCSGPVRAATGPRDRVGILNRGDG